MNVVRGRARRPDDWPSSHVRARTDLSDRLDFPLEPDEATWLSAHLDTCPDCRAIADAYVAQRLELRALLDRTPSPPRDLWARTAAAIEAEAGFRDRRSRQSGWRDPRLLAPSALLAAALVVAVAVGTLTSSQRPFGDGDAGSSVLTALGTTPAPIGSATPGARATRIPVTQKIAYVAKESGGTFAIKTKIIDKVCPSPSPEPCDDQNATVDRQVTLDQSVSTVFGSRDDARLIVMNDPTSANKGTISVVTLASEAPAASPIPSASPALPESASPVSGSASPSVEPSTPTSTGTPAGPSPSATPVASDAPSPSVAVTPTPSGAIEIAHDVVLVGQSAAYSPSGDWFAFTARPADGTAGPDIFAWKVGDARANRMTSDHRSIFGSWAGESIIGSTLVDSRAGSGASAPTVLQPVSFLLDPTTNAVAALPQAGRAWRPAVDPTGRRAVYWAGSVRITGSAGFAPDAGRLVLGDWSATTPSASDSASAAPPTGDQGAARHETTIQAGRLDEWDARWDATGTHLAIWIADPKDPTVGTLSLFAVDSFDGKIDLKAPLLDATPAAAGYAISSGQLVWAEPPTDGATNGRIQLIAWTDEGVGTVSTVTGPAFVIR